MNNNYPQTFGHYNNPNRTVRNQGQNQPRKRKISETNHSDPNRSDPERDLGNKVKEPLLEHGNHQQKVQNQSRNMMIMSHDDNSNERQSLGHFQGNQVKYGGNRESGRGHSAGSRNTTPSRESKGGVNRKNNNKNARRSRVNARNSENGGRGPPPRDSNRGNYNDNAEENNKKIPYKYRAKNNQQNNHQQNSYSKNKYLQNTNRNSSSVPEITRSEIVKNSEIDDKKIENIDEIEPDAMIESPENSFQYPPGINYEQPNSTIAPTESRHQDTVPHAANSASPGFSSRNQVYNEPAPSTNAYDLSYLPHANSVLRDFDFNNVQYPMHSEFARAALDHELQQCRTDAEQVQLLKSLLLQSETRARNQLLKYHEVATLNTLEVFKKVDQTKRIKNTLFKYKRIDKQVEENQRLRELINSCCASLDTYNKKAGKEVVVAEIPVVDKVEDILNVKKVEMVKTVE
jgi:hypothetical protein